MLTFMEWPEIGVPEAFFPKFREIGRVATSDVTG